MATLISRWSKKKKRKEYTYKPEGCTTRSALVCARISRSVTAEWYGRVASSSLSSIHVYNTLVRAHNNDDGLQVVNCIIIIIFTMSIRAAAATTIEVDDSAGNYHQSGGGGGAGLLKPSGGHSSRLDLRNLLGRPGGGPSLKGASVSAPSTPVEDAAVVSNSTTTGVANTHHHLYVAPPKYGIKKRGSSSGPGLGEGVLKELIHPAHADALKAHSTLTLKLLKTGNIYCVSIIGSNGTPWEQRDVCKEDMSN